MLRAVMARSDSNSPEPTGRMLDTCKARHSSGSGLDEEDKTIHSGHFMLSQVHDRDSDTEEEVLAFPNDNKGFDFVEANRFPSRTYAFGPRSTQTLAIDASLTKLFKCMTLAYSGKITSPKWKPFKGMPLSLKDKVRLNNIIWREWPMQYIYSRRPVVCQFATPVSDEVHSKPEAVVLEGKYWKRRLKTVTAEYKKWRKYYKERVLLNPSQAGITDIASLSDLLERIKDVNQALPRHSNNQTDPNQQNDEDFIMDFSDTLFTTLNQPFPFPNPRELSQYGYADIIQPGLEQLQPTLDDICMDTFEPLHDFMNIRGQQTNIPTVFTGQSSRHTYNELESLLSQGDFSTTSLPMELLNSLGNTAQGSPGLLNQANIMQTALSSFASQFQGQNTNLGTPTQFNHLTNMDLSTQPAPPDTQMIVDPPNSPPQYSSIYSHTQNILPTVNQKHSTPAHQKGGNLQGKPHSSATQAIQGKARQAQTIQHKQLTSLHHTRGSAATMSKQRGHNNQLAPKASSSAGKPTSSEQLDKRDANFAVPKGKPLASRSKQRLIAPAPANQQATPTVTSVTQQTSNLVQKNTYLAQLLTTGSYPGAVIKVEKETNSQVPPCVNNTVSIPPYRPLTTSTDLQTPVQPITQNTPGGIAIVTNVGDFPASVLIAAASQALGTNTVSVRDVTSMSLSSEITRTISSPIPTPSSSLAQSLLSSSTMPNSPSTFSNQGSPASIGSPTDFNLSSSPSPSKSLQLKQEHGRAPHREERKRSHISAEQKRRCNIKSGFDIIHAIIPSLGQNPNAKFSKAAMLQKTAEHCKKLKSERTQMQEEADILKREIESLNSAINACQLQLPATGVPVTRQRADKMKELFEEYVKNRTLVNWRFWIFSSIIRSLFESYNSMVSTVSLDELCRSVLAWMDQHCSLVSLRPTVLNSLRQLSTTTSILSDPSQVPDQVTRAVTRQNSGDNPGNS